MPNCIKRIEIIGIHGLFDITQDFSSGINILHGVNGSAKTTLVHVITNILNGDYERFLYISFSSIKVWYDDDNFISIHKDNENNEYDNENTKTITVCVNNDRRGVKFNDQINEFNEFEKELTIEEKSELEVIKDYTQTKVILPTAYFPAFRTMIEAWQSTEENIDTDKTTKFARKVFGEFTPKINYPSPRDIEQSLRNEIEEIAKKISLFERQIMAQVTIDFISSSIKNDLKQTLETSKMIITKIELLFLKLQSYPIPKESYISSSEIYLNIKNNLNLDIDKTDTQIRLFLNIFYDSLHKIHNKFQDEYSKIDKYLSGVNRFLKGKSIAILKTNKKGDNLLVAITYDDIPVLDSLNTLSSGERQILTILYATTYMSDEKLVIVDEPEISLHIDWQRKLLKEISEQLYGKQIIACTHSPMIAADYEDYLRELQSKYTDRNLWGNTDVKKDDIINISKSNNDFDEYDFVVDDKEDK
jgi:predicted ATP-binding protein involved in virulence